MKRLVADITDELKTILDEHSAKTGEQISAYIERILRDQSELESLRKKLKLKWRDRPKMGRPKLKVE